MKGLLVLSVLCIAGSLATPRRDASDGVVFCYYGSWVNGRTGEGSFGVDDIPLDLCTHIVYSFLGLTSEGELELPEEIIVNGNSNYVEDLIALKEESDVQILAGIGGWNEGSANFSIVVNDDTLRANFVNNLYNYIDSNGFDGLDVDWNYPAQRGGVESDKDQFVVLLQELKDKFADDGYILTAAVGVTQSNIEISYDVLALNDALDYISLMLYDYHGAWDSVTGVNAPLYPQLTDAEDSDLNVAKSINVWIENGASPSKLVMGLASYGKTFTLESLSDTATGAASTGAGEPGLYTLEAGNCAYYEICADQQANASDWQITEVPGNYVYANKGLFWVGYDSVDTIYAKAQYAKDMGLAGIKFWSVDMDDFQGLCGEKYPLIKSGIAGYSS